MVNEFREYLLRNERSEATIEKYLRNVVRFMNWSGGRELSKELVIEYKASLTESVSTVNGVISAINSFLVFLGRPE